MSASDARRGTPCEGWWEQQWLGRQTMDELRVSVSPPLLAGSGTDVVGAFVLQGDIAADGIVEIRKTYLGKHQVVYVGHYDGEGRLWGTWACCGDRGRWMIALRGGGAAGDDALAAELPADPLADVPQIAPQRR